MDVVTRGADNPFLDLQIWPHIKRRDDDIVIATYAKFGYLRMQVILHELVSASKGGQNRLLPWVELSHQKSKKRIDVLEEFTGRRILRTHLPSDNIHKHSGKYIFIGRDPRDLVFNAFHFLKGVNENWYNHFGQYGPQLSKPTQNFESFWKEWMENDGEPLWPYFQHLQSWWEKRNEANVLLIHFLDFKDNMEKELRRISDFLDLKIRPESWPDLLEACNYSRVSKVCLEEANIESPFWNGGRVLSEEASLSHSWKECLTDIDEAELENKVFDIIGKTGKNWLLRH